MNVIVLDFDGVLSSKKYIAFLKELYGHALPDDEPLDPIVVRLVDAFAQSVDASVVISTAWRWRYGLSLSVLEGYLRDKGLTVPVAGILPNPVATGPHEPLVEHRGECVKAWLDQHPEVNQHVVLDDLDESVPGLNWVRTIEEEGVRASDLEEARQYFVRIPITGP